MTPEVGDYVIISPHVNSVWAGTWKVKRVYKGDGVCIVHPAHGEGYFNHREYKLITSKLHKVLR